MMIKKIGISCALAGVGTLAARIAVEHWNEAAISAASQAFVMTIFDRFLFDYIKTPRQLVFYDLTTLLASCAVGMIAAKLFCQKQIEWRKVASAQALSWFATNMAWTLLHNPAQLSFPKKLEGVR